MVYLLRYRGLAYSFRPVVATGGNITTTTVNGIPYRVHTFTSLGSSNFVITDPGSEREVEYLVVAGGGGGGTADNEFECGGGGGSGGLLTSIDLGPYKISTGSIPITVGDGGRSFGGNGITAPSGENGQNSRFGDIVCFGGGGGGSGQGLPALNGGSGGGAGARVASAGLGFAGPPRQGNNGYRIPGTRSNESGGGGGAFAAAFSRAGGVGRTLNFINNLINSTYAVGGNGNIGTSGGAFTEASAPSNTGNGGIGGKAAGEGAGNPTQRMNAGGKGGSGIVVVRYPLSVIPA
jgi:hypothetical protein